MKRTLLLAAALAAPTAFAAGGHHAVDDAAILEPGQCELEGWFAPARGGERLLHAGAGCRVGPVEIGAAAEAARQSGATATGYELSAKWAREIAGGFSVGAALAPSWQARSSPRYQGLSAAALATFAPAEPFALHLNLGRDFVHRGRDQARHGLSAEWMPGAGWSLLAERYLQEGGHFVRAGARYAFGEDWSLDFSRAHHLRGSGASRWTLGIGRVFGSR